MKRFHFNDHTFQYEAIRRSRADVLRSLGWLAGFALVVAVAFLAITLRFVGNLEEGILRNKVAVLHQQVQAESLALQKQHQRLDELHQRDNSFYRSILNVDRIDDAVWNAGIGGDNQVLSSPVRQLQAHISRLDHRLRLQRESFAQLLVLAEQKTEELKHIPAIRPIGTSLISGFGYRANPFDGHTEFHQGLDFKSPIGTPVRATGAGVVCTAGTPESGYGIQIEVDHGFGYKTKYAHLSKVLKKVGDKVNRGDVVGLSGNTGYSTGPHLHYEVIRSGVKVNPMDFFYTN